jgi:hypothetical protein
VLFHFIWGGSKNYVIPAVPFSVVVNWKKNKETTWQKICNFWLLQNFSGRNVRYAKKTLFFGFFIVLSLKTTNFFTGRGEKYKSAR